MAVTNTRIFEMVADPTTYQNKQTGFDDTADSDLGFKMFSGKDSDGNVTKMLAKDKPAKVQTLDVRDGGQFTTIDDDGFTTSLITAGNTVSGDGRIAFDDDFLSAAGIKARFADSVAEAGSFLAAFGDVSVMKAVDDALGNLSTGQILMGDRAGGGTIDQDSNLTFDSSDVLHIGSGTQKLDIAWDRIHGGNSVTIGGSVGSSIALNGAGGSLTLNGDMSNSIVCGRGTIDADDSIVVGDANSIGQGTGHSTTGASNIVCVGENNTIDADNGEYIGSYIDADGTSYSKAMGSNITIDGHDNVECKGKYVVAHFPDAKFFGTDKYSVAGDLEAFCNWTLVGETDGSTTCVLRPRYADTGPTIVVPDGLAIAIEICLMSCVDISPAASSNGMRTYKSNILLWNNDSKHYYELGSQTSVLTKNATWVPTITCNATGTAGSGQFEIGISIGGTSYQMSHNAQLRGLISQTTISADS